MAYEARLLYPIGYDLPKDTPQAELDRIAKGLTDGNALRVLDSLWLWKSERDPDNLVGAVFGLSEPPHGRVVVMALDRARLVDERRIGNLTLVRELFHALAK